MRHPMAGGAIRRCGACLWLAVIALAPQAALSEPYLAIREGLKCIACHVNPSGGGMRNDFGRAYGQRVLPSAGAAEYGDFRLSESIAVGANFRFNLESFRQSGAEDTLSFETERANVYLHAALIPRRLALYLDQQLAPAGLNREAWALVRNDAGTLYAKAGKLFLPFGWRLQDDSAFVRESSGINFLTPDNGVELGVETGRWSGQLAVSNGSAGGGETDEGKQLTARLELVERRWRIGAGVSRNDADGDRLLAGIFSGLNVLGSEVLAEAVWIRDTNIDALADDREQLATLLEINREVIDGNNVKLTLEFLDPDLDVDEDHRNRISLVWEATPIPLLQIRLGTRQSEGIPQSPVQNADLYFVQLHAWY